MNSSFYALLFCPLVAYAIYAIVQIRSTRKLTPDLTKTAGFCHPGFCREFHSEETTIACKQDGEYQRKNAYRGKGCEKSRARLDDVEMESVRALLSARTSLWDKLISVIAIIITALTAILLNGSQQ